MGSPNISHNMMSRVNYLFNKYHTYFCISGMDNEVVGKNVDQLYEANSYDRLDFVRPARKLNAHYQSSRTLKSMGSTSSGSK